jgi:hypothetical protein
MEAPPFRLRKNKSLTLIVRKKGLGTVVNRFGLAILNII